MKPEVLISAMIALVTMPAQGGGAAANNGIENFDLWPSQCPPIPFPELASCCANDVGHLEGWPGHRGCNLRERFTESGLDTLRVSKGLGTAVKCLRDRWR